MRRAASTRHQPILKTPTEMPGDPANPDFSIEDWPFYLIARASRRYEQEMERALLEIDMDVPSWRALILVHERSPSSVSEIAAHSVINLSTMTRVVQRLEKRGFVTLSQRPADARVTDVYITRDGADVAKKVREVASQIYKLAFRDFKATDIGKLNQTMRAIFANLN